MQLDRTQRRILGSLIEKRWSTPDQYPLSMNALVAACNQKSNRDPVMELHDFEITGCLLDLREKGLILMRERDGGHIQRYAERISEHLELDVLTSAVTAELMLRGPQTSTELVRRCARMAPDADLESVEASLVGLARNRLAVLQARQPGQRMARWAHLMAAEEEAPEEVEAEVKTEPTPAAEPAPVAAAPTPPGAPVPPDDVRVEMDELRREVAELRERLERLESVVL